VYALVGGAEPDFGLLEERDFVRRRQGSSLAGQREYAIKHALTREVAYAGLPKAVRGPRHAAFADWLEQEGGGRDEHAPLLAHHYAEAVRPEEADLAWQGREREAERLRGKAIAWSQRAADLAVGRYEIDDGLALLHRALELENDPRNRGALWRSIGLANALKFDGPGFQEAMERAIELDGPTPELCTELALHAVHRGGLWFRQADPELIDGWVKRAIELSPKGSPTYPSALAAKVMRTKDEAAALELRDIAERLGDAELRSHALAALTVVAWQSGDLDRVRATVEERLTVLAHVSAPDDRHWALMQAVAVNLAQGRLAAADDACIQLTRTVAGLTAHHRLHGVEVRLWVEALADRWEEVGRLAPRIVAAVEANAATPCPGNASALVLLAVARTRDGDAAEARRLEVWADAMGWEGYHEVEASGLYLALARNDVAELRRRVHTEDVSALGALGYDTAAVLFDGLVVLGDRERIEAAAPAWLGPGYVEPFALRALGIARGDAGLTQRAAARFDAIGLHARAAEAAGAV
jgi:hypothetical protein